MYDNGIRIWLRNLAHDQERALNMNVELGIGELELLLELLYHHDWNVLKGLEQAKRGQLRILPPEEYGHDDMGTY